jgi:hypothetical protein
MHRWRTELCDTGVVAYSSERARPPTYQLEERVKEWQTTCEREDARLYDDVT